MCVGAGQLGLSEGSRKVNFISAFQSGEWDWIPCQNIGLSAFRCQFSRAESMCSCCQVDLGPLMSDRSARFGPLTLDLAKSFLRHSDKGHEPATQIFCTYFILPLSASCLSTECKM